ncbi:DUF1254 domain-containing protein [Photobacterium rosenbergii]|uniref:DUF1254 domain-containing protein n=1 Tax=Photobacterium rosenbergii TaxID=294936 RepID=UPI001C998491|nr:DUF1254 domain-containing protein [Photobacterium rosenbergii]MBY5948373.1 DUF1254 domain-containing protein [Photobacterium rosenbergii]
MKKTILAALITTAAFNISTALAKEAVTITQENYELVETYQALKNIHKLVGENKFFHFRNPTPLDNQTVVRMNHDTLYSGYVTDMSKGGTITLPETGDRYISVMVVLKDHYINQFFTGGGTYEIAADDGFGMIVVRTEINANDPEDVKLVNQLQDQVKIEMGSNTQFNPPNYDLDTLLEMRHRYAAEAATKGSLNNMQGARGEVDPYMHILGTAAGWGLLPDRNARYLSYTHEGGSTDCVSATYDIPPFRDPGFFSITMYDKEGWIANNNAVLNKHNIVMKDENSFDVSFGDCSDAKKKVNHLPTTEGWNFLMRVYEPNLDKLDNYIIPTAK